MTYPKPPSATDYAAIKTEAKRMPTTINQVLKSCQITMQSAAFLEKEVSDLCAANEKKKQKRTRSNRQIPREEGLSVQEAVELIEAPIEAPIAPAPPPPPRGQDGLHHLYSRV